MPPQTTPNSDPNQQPLPAQPVVSPEAVAQPQAVPQPPQPVVQPQQPIAPAPAVPGAVPGQPTGVQLGDIGKERKIALLFAIGGMTVFIVGFLVGFAALLGAFLGAYGARRGKLVNYNLAFVLGLIAAVLNILLYASTFFIS